MNDLTILISGPLHATGIESIDYYLTLNKVKVVFSTWEPVGDQQKSLLVLLLKKLPHENIVISKYFTPTGDNKQNVYFHAYAVKQGLSLIHTKYTVKIRSDCKFDNIKPLLERVLHTKQKIVCVSCFFRPCKNTYYAYCSSDFVFGTDTTNLRAIFNLLIVQLETCDRWLYHNMPAERKICKAILLHFDKDLDFDVDNLKQASEHMKAVFDIVDVNSLNPTLNYHGSANIKHFNHNHDLSITNVDQI
jgi:ribosomal protein S24E